MLAVFPLNWLETTFLLVVWAALCVDVLRQQWISRGGKIAWIVFIILVPVVSWIAYGIVRHRHGVGPGR
jgi:Phospholipase_D-nuclease N-terminal